MGGFRVLCPTRGKGLKPARRARQLRRDRLQPAQEEFVPQPLQEGSRPLQLRAVASALGEDDAHARGVGDKAMRFSALNSLSQW